MAFLADNAPANAYISFFPTDDPFDTDDPGGGIDTENDREDVVELYWKPLLVIALWSTFSHTRDFDFRAWRPAQEGPELFAGSRFHRTG
jgi:hypothetical protein